MPSFNEDCANTRHINTNLYKGGYAQAATTLSSAIDSPWHRLQARELKYCCITKSHEVLKPEGRGSCVPAFHQDCANTRNVNKNSISAATQMLLRH